MNARDCTPGLRVTYRPHNGADLEHGIITRISDRTPWVFVRFDGDLLSKACAADQLDPAL